MDENGQVRYLGKSSGYYLLQNSRTFQNGAFHFANYGNRPRHEKRSSNRSDPSELPPKDLSQHLITLYFNHFYPFLPLFYKRDLSVDQPISPLLLNSIYAVASRISPDVRVRSDPTSPDTAGDIYFERAEKLLDASYDLPSISTVQALLLLASHQHGRMKSARAWLYSGMAFRMAQDLGLHRNCDRWNISPDECERRKRVFWCCFVVDRLASAMYGRASTFEERDCDVPFPSVDDAEPIYGGESTESPVRLLDTFTNLVKVCDILGHVLKDIYYVRSLQNTATKQADTVLTTWNKRLHQWYAQLPDSLQIKKDNHHTSLMPPTAVCQLHMIYHTTVILLHRPFISGPNQSLIPSLLPCASICSSAADSVLSIASAMLSENKLRYVMNYAVYYIFTSAIIFIKSASITYASDSNNSKSLEYKVKVTKCMQVLDEIEGTWTTASELAGFRDFNPFWKKDEASSSLSQQHVQSPNYNSSPPSSASSQVLEHSGRVNASTLRYPIIGDHQHTNTEFQSLSSQNMGYAAPNQFPLSKENDNNNNNNNNIQTASTADPFAAPGIIPMTDTRQYSQLGAPFWGVPSSLDANEWDNFMSTGQDAYLQDRQLFEPATAPIALVGNYPEKQHLIHTDQNVDILSGVSTPLEHKTASTPTLLSYLPHMQHNNNTNNHSENMHSIHNDKNRNNFTNNDGRPSSLRRDLANAHYW
ncbi:fungal-specific transcription factor domain-containing protein [Thamnidium elegans]|nr:fungal-specific transcription factor domain-containing protein [Thamnidium elegans]